ncbi:unnamed protein product, partial [Allacma fusca]
MVRPPVTSEAADPPEIANNPVKHDTTVLVQDSK